MIASAVKSKKNLSRASWLASRLYRHYQNWSIGTSKHESRVQNKMSLQNWFAKACDMLSSTWRSQGAPESDDVATEDFLKQLSTEYAKGQQDETDLSYSALPTTSIAIDEEGFDCRVGKRAQKRRREAHMFGDLKLKHQSKSDAKLKPQAKGKGTALSVLLLQAQMPRLYQESC